MVTQNTLDWLMEGDPVIRWQVMRDLMDLTEAEVDAERAKTVDSGWGAAFVDSLQPDGTWPEGRWTGSPWVLLMIMDCGLPSEAGAVQVAAAKFLGGCLGHPKFDKVEGLLRNMDLCHVGFWLRIGATFTPNDPRLSILIETIRKTQMDDGGWNCRIRVKPQTVHSSFHTTFNILEGLRAAHDQGLVATDEFRLMEAKAMEFVLAHRLFKSDKTGEIISPRFTDLSFPSHWHYTVLRGLDYLRLTPEISDPRTAEALALLDQKRSLDGTWKLGKPIPGKLLFAMEKPGQPSRWNTLRALRVLRRANPSIISP